MPEQLKGLSLYVGISISSSLNSSNISILFSCFFFTLIALSINFFSNSCFNIMSSCSLILRLSFCCWSRLRRPCAKDSICFSVLGLTILLIFLGFSILASSVCGATSGFTSGFVSGFICCIWFYIWDYM